MVKHPIPIDQGWWYDHGEGYIDLIYPRSNPVTMRSVEIGLEDVRAADSIRVSYDFDRDGWVIQQNATLESGEMLDDWQEVAFVKAWGRSIGEGK